MAAFSDLITLLTSLSNKIRSKLGTSTTYTPTNAIAAIDDVYTKGVTDTKVGTAVAGDVLSGKTFTNSSSVGASGSMTNNGAVSQSLNCGDSYTVPAGYHNGSGTVTANSLASQTGVDSGKTAVTAGTMVSGYQGWVNGSKITGTFAGQEKTVTAGTSAASVTPDSGKYLTKVTYNPTPSQTKSASPSTSAQTISPDSGKLLSSVSISAISPQRSAGTAATYSGVDSTGPYVYFPYGWWPQAHSTYGNYTRMTATQAVTACPKQEKTATPTTSSQSITPDSGKLLSKVTVNAVSLSGNAGNANVLSGKTYYNTTLTKQTGTMANRSSTIQQATTSTSDQSKSCYRLNGTNIEVVPAIGYWGTWDWNTECIRVDRASCNYNTGTYTPGANGAALDMGATNNYRYVNTNNVYNQGKGDGQKAALSRVQNNVDAKTMLSISFRSGDVLAYSDRNFTRTSSRPAYACVIFTDDGYYGYCLISMYSDAFSGTSSAYGGLETVQSRTANGYTYYWAAMTSKYPGGVNPNAMTLHISGTSTYVSLPWIPTQYKNQYWYAGVDAFVADVLCKI